MFVSRVFYFAIFNLMKGLRPLTWLPRFLLKHIYYEEHDL